MPSPSQHWKRLPEALKAGTSAHYRDPALYDLEYQDRVADVQWYRAVAVHKYTGLSRQKPRSILELGAGTGRISLPLAKDGHQIFALDRMSEMLDHLQHKLACQADEISGSVETIEGDLLKLPLRDAQVSMVFAPFNVLMHIYDWASLLAAFREVYRVLVPGGVFAFDVLLPDLDWLMWDDDVRHAPTRFRDPHTGEWMFYSTNHRYDPSTQICHIKLYYDRPASPRSRSLKGSTLVRTVQLAHRQIFPEELRMLVAQAGFELLCHDGDFGQADLEPGVESQSLCCQKPR